MGCKQPNFWDDAEDTCGASVVADRATSEVARSFSFDQSDILRWITKLHCPEGFEVDCTFGNGGFYKDGQIPQPKYKYDLTPLHDDVIQADSQMLPHEPSSVSSIVFDPPFLTYVKNGRSHKGGDVVMTRRFGGYWRYDELEEHYRGSLSEFHRILKKKGVVVFKCQDIIHNHKMHCTHQNTINWAEYEGFRLKDIFILPAKHRMPSPQKGIQRHARVFHSYFLVLEKK